MLGTTALLGTLLSLISPAVNEALPDTPPVVEVDGSRLVDGEGQIIQLRGVNRSGAEYACVNGTGVFDGPVDSEAIETIRAWEVNAVRVPLNEDCWLGASALDPSLSGAPYRDAIADFADRLAEAGMVVILDLHWTGRGEGIARDQQPMAREGRSPEFWRSVASTFSDHRGVIFDVFNEPHSVGWACWRDGCEGHAGMQDLVDAIRSTGADHPIVLSGLDWGGDLRRWLEFRPDDPVGALIAGVHLYDFKRCASPECWDVELGAVAEQHPVVVAEFGDTDCDGDFSNELMRWADNAGVSYLAWAWNEWDCHGGPALISDFSGTATPYGEKVKLRLASRATPTKLPIRLPAAIPA